MPVERELHIAGRPEVFVIGDAAAAKDVRIEVDTGPEADSVFADPTALRQILSNLLENAVRYDESLAKVEGGNGRMGVVGFCYGGAMANFLATRLPDLAAAAPF